MNAHCVYIVCTYHIFCRAVYIPSDLFSIRGSQMARFVWIVLALSPRDGGWQRLGVPGPFPRHFPTQEMAWEFVELMWDLFVEAGDYVTIDVRKTIAF